MDLQGLSFNRQTEDIKLTPEATLKLQAGDVVRGLVQAITSDGLVQLLVRGKSVMAEAQVPLHAGQELFLQMDRMENGKLYLRVVDPQVQAELPDLALRGLVTKLGLKADELTSTIARKLIAYNMPVTRENIEAIIKMTNLAGADDGRVLEAATYALSRNSRITDPEKITNLVEFFSSPRAQEKTGQAIYQLTIADSPDKTEKVVNTGGVSLQNTETAEVTTQQKPTAAAPADAARAEVIVNNRENKAVTDNTGIGPKVTINDDTLQQKPTAFSSESPDLLMGEEIEAANRPGTPKGEPVSNGSVNQVTVNKTQAAADITESIAASTTDSFTDTKVTTVTGDQRPVINNTDNIKGSTVPPLVESPKEGSPVLTNQPAVGEENKSALIGVNSSKPEAAVSSPNKQGTAVDVNLILGEENAGPEPTLIKSAANRTAGSDVITKDTANPDISKTGERSQVLNRLVSSNQPSSEATTKNMGAAVQTSTMDIKSGASAAALNTLTQNSDSTIDQVVRRLSDLIRPALEAIITDLDQGKPDGNQIKQVLKDQQALLPEIKFTRQILDQISNGINHPVRAAVESLEQEWSGQQLYNRLEGSAVRDQNNIYFNLPLRWQGRVENAEVSVNWRRDNRTRTSLPDNLTVNVGLSTVNMGTVVFHLRTQSRQIGLSVYLDNDTAKNKIDEAMPELLAQINRLGYQTSFMGSQVINRPNLHPQFIDNAKENLPPVTGLDLKI